MGKLLLFIKSNINYSNIVIMIIFYIFFISLHSFILEAVMNDKLALFQIWLDITFTLIFTLNYLYLNDKDTGSLELYYICPMYFEIVILLRSLIHFINTGLPLVIITPIITIFMNTDNISYLSLFLSAMSISLLGNIFSSIILVFKSNIFILTILIIPFCLPIIIFGITNKHVLQFIILLFYLIVFPFFSQYIIKNSF